MIELTPAEAAKLKRKSDLAEAWAKFMAESEKPKTIKAIKNAKMPAGIYHKKFAKGTPKSKPKSKPKKRITAQP